jgi:hypothetical protein
MAIAVTVSTNRSAMRHYLLMDSKVQTLSAFELDTFRLRAYRCISSLGGRIILVSVVRKVVELTIMFVSPVCGV